jgi:hypothetical protein
VNTHDEHVLVDGSVEDSDIAVLGDGVVNAPEIVVGSFFGRRLLKRYDMTPLRVTAAHHMANRAIFSTRVATLQHDQ